MYDPRAYQVAEHFKVGWAADPALSLLFDKRLIARIKVRQLEMLVTQLENELELANLQLDMLKEEYGRK